MTITKLFPCMRLTITKLFPWSLGITKLFPWRLAIAKLFPCRRLHDNSKVVPVEAGHCKVVPMQEADN